jgi:putative transposase
MRWVMDTHGWIVEVVMRAGARKGFVPFLGAGSWSAMLGWFNWCRRLSKDYEVLPQTSEAFIYVANIRLMLRRLA